MQVHACAFGQASAALVERHGRGRNHDEVSEAMLSLSRWLSSEHDKAEAWPAVLRLPGPGRDPVAFPRSARRHRGGTVTTPAETAQATTAILESGAMMLGAALVFVMLFRQLKLGATLAISSRRADRAADPPLDCRSNSPASPRSESHCSCSSSLELQPRRLWRLRHDIFGLGLLQVVSCGLAISACISPLASRLRQRSQSAFR